MARGFKCNIWGHTIKEKSPNTHLMVRFKSQNLNSVHLSLRLYSAPSFRKWNFSQRVPFKNSKSFSCTELTPRFSHSGPSDFLTSFENKSHQNINTTVQTHAASSPDPHASVHGTVRRRALSHGPARNHKNTSETKQTLTREAEPAPERVVWTHSCWKADPASCTKSWRGDCRLLLLLLRGRAALLFSHSAPQRKKKHNRQN